MCAMLGETKTLMLAEEVGTMLTAVTPMPAAKAPTEPGDRRQ